MKKLLLTSALSLLTLLGFGQIWNQVGSGLSNSVSYVPIAYEIGGSIAVSYGDYDNVNQTTTFHTEVWNGASWSAYPSYTASNLQYISGAAAVNGIPYFSYYNGGIKYFNGSTWSTLSLPSTGDVWQTLGVNGQLLIHGSFSNGDWGYLYDGTSFTVLPTPATNTAGISDALYYNGELYIAGALDSNSITGPVNILKLSGGSWVNPITTLTGGTLFPGQNTRKLLEYNGDLLIFTNSEILRMSGSTAIFEGNTGLNMRDAEVYNGEVYISNGATAGNLAMAKFDGNVISTITQAPRNLNMLVFQGELYGFSNQATYNGVNYNSAYRTLAGFSFADGAIFLDANQDCLLNAGEQGVPGMAVHFSDGTIATTDQNGMYSVNLAPGTYTVNSVTSIDQVSSNVSASCSLPGFTLTAASTSTNNVGASLASVEDVSVHVISAWRARFGFTENYNVVVSNLGLPVAAGGTLELDIPASVNLVSTNPTATVNGNTLSWTLGAMNSFDKDHFNVELEVDTSTNNVGDTLHLQARLIGFGNDADLSNNTEDIHQEVRAAYDPNDKQVNIEFTQPGIALALDYYIRFQNTGNDTAYKVVIVDTLSSKLDVESFRMIGATHEYEVRIEDNKVAIFTFDNILLPDSTTDLEGSQGGLRFSINTAAALADGEQVSNDAYIYFDFQQPIHTNYAITEAQATFSLVEQRSGVPTLEMFPNPARDVVQLKSLSNHREEISLYSMNGQLVKRFLIPAKGTVQLELNEYQSGIYFVKTTHETYKLNITR